MLEKILRDLPRLFLMAAIGYAIVCISDHLPKVAPLEWSWAPALKFGGVAFIAAAFTHILRRLFFPQIDLQKFMHKAFDHPIGAGLVALGVCQVIAPVFSQFVQLVVR